MKLNEWQERKYAHIVILTIYAAIRFFYRKKNKFSGIEIQSRTIQYDKNKKMHAKEFLDICILLAVILPAVIFGLDTGYKAYNGCVAAMIVFAALFCIAAHYSVVYDNVLVKSITILFSTMQGAILSVVCSIGLIIIMGIALVQRDGSVARIISIVSLVISAVEEIKEYAKFQFGYVLDRNECKKMR